MNRKKEIEEMVRTTVSHITSDKDMQVAFADALRRGARWGYTQATERILNRFGIHIECTKDNHSEEMPWVWVLHKKQPGRWGGSATYYFPEKSGEAETYDDASEQALQEALEIIKP